jgi:hypothetical protein
VLASVESKVAIVGNLRIFDRSTVRIHEVAVQQNCMRVDMIVRAGFLPSAISAGVAPVGLAQPLTVTQFNCLVVVN